MSRTLRRWVVVVGAYCIVGLVPVWNLLRQGITSHTVSPDADPAMPIWGIGYYAHAIAHGHLPFVTDMINAPSGFSTWISTPLWSLLLVPVTWMVGAVGSFNLLLFGLPVLNSVTMYIALRRHVRLEPVRWCAGLAWGFSPFVMSGLALGWINWGTQVSIPLIVAVISELGHDSRWTARRTGLALAALGAVTFYSNSEELVILAGAAVVALGTQAIRRLLLRQRFDDATRRFVLASSLWTLIPLVVVTFPASYFATHGVGALPDWVWPRWMFETAGQTVSQFVTPATFSGRVFTTQLTYPNFAYVGVATPFFVALGLWRSWRRPAVIVAVVVGLWATIFAMGAHGPFQVSHLLLEFPIVHNVMPRSFVPCVVFAAFLIAAIGIDDLASLVKDRVTVQWFASSLAGLVMTAPVIASAFVAVPWSGRMPGDDPAARALAAQAATPPTFLTYPFPVVGRGLVAQVRSGFTYRVVGAMGPTANRDLVDGEFLQSTMAGFTNFGFTKDLTAPQITRLRSAIVTTGATWAVIPISLPTAVNSWGYAAPQVTVAAYVAMWGAPLKFGNEWAFRITDSEPVRSEALERFPACRRGNPEFLPQCLLARTQK